MKILLIITHGKIGGATNSVFWLAKGLKEKNVDVWVGFGKGDYLKEKLNSEKIPFVNFKWLKRTHNPLVNIFFIFEIKKFLDKEKFDVLHFNSTNTLFGALGAKLLKNKPKTIFTFRGLSILDPGYRKNLPLKIIYWLVFKILLYFIDIPIFICQNNLETAEKLKLTKKGIVIYNGVPEPEFLEKEKAKKLFEEKLNILFKGNFIIGSIGRLDYSKNYEFLISAFPEILKIKNNAILLIIGDGPERKKLENLIEKLNLKGNVFLLGEIKDASKYLKGFDSLVLPSRYEGLSITLIEALFAQIPIFASDVGGNKEIVGEKNVFSLQLKKNFYQKFEENLISISEKNKFKLSQMIEKYLSIYREYVRNSRKIIF